MHDDDQPDDPLPAIIAGIDQMLATAPQLARSAMGLFTVYEAEGFTSSQALYLTAVALTQGPGTAP